MRFMSYAAAVGLAAAFTINTAHGADISGAGATFPYPIYAKWADAYKKETGNGAQLPVDRLGGGIKQIEASTVTFGATDKPLGQEELDKNGLIQFPMIIGGIVPVINVEGIKPGELVIDGPTLAKIFMGEITKWDDAAIKKLNEKVEASLDAPSPSCTAPTDRAPPSTSPTTLPRSAPTGSPKSAPTRPSNGRSASAPRATKAWPTTWPRPRARSAMSNMPMPSRTS